MADQETNNGGASDSQATDVQVVLLGTPQRAQFLDRLRQSADRYDPHVHYSDVHYLRVDGKLLELHDPGLAHTGAQEMALKSADVVLFYFNVHSSSALQKLLDTLPSLEIHRNSIISIVADHERPANSEEDEVRSVASSSAQHSSTSEGYESGGEAGERRPASNLSTGSARIPRRRSMEKIRQRSEEAVEQGFLIENTWSERLGGRKVELLKIGGRQVGWDDCREWLAKLAATGNQNRDQRTRGRSLIRLLRSSNSSGGPSKVGSRGNSTARKSTDLSSRRPTVSAIELSTGNAAVDNRENSTSGKSGKSSAHSRVCAVM